MNGVLDPRICGIRLSMLFRLYGWRLRRHTAQELLAGGGIAVGVALIFGVLLANTSIVGSAEQLASSIEGKARLQMAARSESGFSEALSERAVRLPGVAMAAPLLHQNIELVGPHGRTEVRMVGVTPGLVQLGGIATQNLGAGASLIAGGIGLPSSVAEAIGARPNHRVTLYAGGMTKHVLVRAVLGSSTIGAVADSPVAVALLPVAQELLGKRGRISQLLIVPTRGHERALERQLRQISGPGMYVGSAAQEVALLRATAHPSEQATTMFAALGGMVGFLLTFSAMLLTAPERRRYVADLRMQGYDWRQVLLVLAFEATLLGMIASLLGVGLGLLLSRIFFAHVPVYLAFAFPIGGEEVIRAGTVMIALGAGLLATLLASAQPALDLLPSRPRDAVSHHGMGSEQALPRRAEVGLAALAFALVLAVTLIVLVWPSLTLLGGVLLALATFVLIPPVFALASHAFGRAGEHLRGSAHVLAARELRATPMRSVALAGVAALAVYGSVAILGARQDLIHGLDNAVNEYLTTADVWVSTGDNTLTVDSFADGGSLARLAHLPSVAAVRPYQGALLDVGDRRMWVRARSPQVARQLEGSQVMEGDPTRASALLRRSGWASVSSGFADERGLHVGSRFTLQTPSGPANLRVAAVTTNIGWTPGALTLSAADFQRYWASSAPTAYEVQLKTGVPAAVGREAVRQALDSRPGLVVQTLSQREAVYRTSARQGLRTLGQISTLLLITAALAVAAALSAAIWMRRSWFASLKTKGFSTVQLLRTLLWESAIVLGVGCAVGAVLGIYGHALASRWLEMSTGFPAPFAFGEEQVLAVLGIVAGIALAIVALPGMRAAQVSPQAAFQE